MATSPVLAAAPPLDPASALPLIEQVVAREWMARHPLSHHPLHVILSPQQMRRVAFALWCYQQSGMPL